MTALAALDEPALQVDPPRRLPSGSGFYALVGLLSALLTIPVLDLLHGSLSVPFVYSYDGLSTSVHVKNVIERGWVDYTPGVAAPWGRHGNDFPSADNLHLMVMALLGLFTSSYALVLNLYFLLTFPLIAMAAAWWFRTLGLGRGVSLVLSLLYAFAPYHFLHGEAHLFLSGYYGVPLAAVLLYRVVAGERLWSRGQGRLGGLLTARNVGTLLILAVLGTSSSYYSIFTLLLLTFGGLVALAQTRRWRAMVGVVVAQGWLVAVMLANMAPNLLYQRMHGANLVVPVRGPSGTEKYSFKLSSLLLPWRDHRVDGLAELRQRYDDTFPLPSEYPALGVVAAVGLLYLFAVLLLNVSREPERRLAVLSMGAFLLGTVGGFATFFALFVTDSLRAWDRLSIFLAAFALGAVGLLLERARRWWSTRPTSGRIRYGVSLLTAVLVLLVGLYDQTPSRVHEERGQIATSFHSDARFVGEIEDRLPAQAMVFQLPYMFFPESPRVGQMHDSDQFRMYLHSADLRWSYGGIRGRPDSDWPILISRQRTPRLAALVAVAGFSGVQIDRAGYEDAGQALEAELAQLPGVSPLVSDDRRYSFWDLRDYADQLRRSHPAAELDEVARHVVLHPVSHQLDSRTVVLDNGWSTPQPAVVTLRLGGEELVRVEWPDGSTEVAPGGGTVSRRLLLEPGRSTVHVSGGRPEVLVDDPILSAFAPVPPD